jgi:hypothetical protein
MTPSAANCLEMSCIPTRTRVNLREMSLVPDQVLSSDELAQRTGFTRRHIPRLAGRRKIPDARLSPSGAQWEFPVTASLQAWICFYRVRHRLLRKVRSFRETEILKAVGNRWEVAVFTLNWLQAPIFTLASISSPFTGAEMALGPDCSWDAVEAAMLCGIVVRRPPDQELADLFKAQVLHMSQSPGVRQLPGVPAAQGSAIHNRTLPP